MPEAWRQEFDGTDAEARDFGWSKIVRATRRALDEIGRDRVELAAGSWRLNFLERANRYLPKETTLMPLDFETSLDSDREQQLLRTVTGGRKLVPIVWAHHDDRTYMGRSYTPFANFATLLEHGGASGFAIIHWTTRPHDLYFKSTVTQIWKATRDEPLATTCQEMAARSFGETTLTAGGKYLLSWITEAPMFGRETSDRFMDSPLAKPQFHLQQASQRLALLDSIDSARLARDGAQRLAYYRNFEKFIIAYFESQTAFERAAKAAKEGDYAKARNEITGGVSAEAAIRAYATAASTGGITRGEQALIVSLNLRWLPCVLSLRQALGLEPARYRLGTVLREPLAQGAGSNTFYFDDERRLWKVLGTQSAKSQLELKAIMGDKFEPGRYSIDGAGEVEAADGAVRVETHPGLESIVISRVKPPQSEKQ